MTMQVIGTGVGRTGTYSLRLALAQLGFGPCYHMETVLHNMDPHVALWNAALDGKPDWKAIYAGHPSAVDWPTGCFFRELYEAYPNARFVHTTRSAESWADSFGSTIYKLIAGRHEAPPEMRDWLDMANRVVVATGFEDDLDRDGLMRGFRAHDEAVRDAIPAEQLLVFEVKEGWAPLCAFLGKPVPTDPFPRTNDRSEFWDLVQGKA